LDLIGLGRSRRTEGRIYEKNWMERDWREYSLEIESRGFIPDMELRMRMKQRVQMRRKIRRIRTQESRKKLYATVVEVGLLWRIN